jgi:hypothetical protein
VSPIGGQSPALDPRGAARVARLLRWYPREWRDRYGDEFEAVLCSSLSDGKGGLRLSLDVVREGLVARLEGAGFLGRWAPPLERARASVVTFVLAVVGFLTSTAVLAYYATGWQRVPALESLDKANQAFQRSNALHVYQRTLASQRFQELQRAAQASNNGNSPAWKSWEKAQTQASTTLNRTSAGHSFQEATRQLHSPSGAAVVFNRITHVATDAVIVCLGLILVMAVAAGIRAMRRGLGTRLRLPMTLLLLSGVLFALGEIAYRADQRFAFGERPERVWTTLSWIVHGNVRFWPEVVFPACTAASVVLVLIGGVKLVRRVDFGPRAYRLMGSIAIVAAGALGIVLASTLSWATTVCVQAPGFLTSKDQGVLGTSLLPVFILAVVVMVGAGWLAVASSSRCLRSIRTV